MLDLGSHSGSIIHSIDPFKVPIAVAKQKAKLLSALGCPFVIIASTDFHREFKLQEYISALAESGCPPIVTHFLPRVGIGYPVFRDTSAALCSRLLNAKSPYFRDSARAAFSETVLPTGGVRLVTSTALTIGSDPKTSSLLDISFIDPSVRAIAPIIAAYVGSTEVIYLFSRQYRVSSRLCRGVAQVIRNRALLFVSGGISERDEATNLLAAGANYVVIGTALEREDWETVARIVFGKHSVSSGGVAARITGPDSGFAQAR
jgi:heptaprenylglyceryl phosphate synthase